MYKNITRQNTKLAIWIFGGNKTVGYMIGNSLKLTWKLKRKGKPCFKHPTKVPKLQRKAAKKTPKTSKNFNEMGQNTIWNTNIIHHWSPWSKLNLKSRMYTDVFTRMPYISKKNSKTMIDIIETPKTLKNCHEMG